MPSARLPIDVRSVSSARSFLRRTLEQYGLQSEFVPHAAVRSVEDAELMLSELVTNAVRHTRSLLQLEITLDGSTLRVAVVDDAPGVPIRRTSDHGATEGRGLAIVDTLADRWGIAPGAGRKSVWFDVTLPVGLWTGG